MVPTTKNDGTRAAISTRAMSKIINPTSIIINCLFDYKNCIKGGKIKKLGRRGA